APVPVQRGLLQVGRAGPREVHALELLDRAVPPEPVEGLVDAAPKRVALLEDHAEPLLRAERGELPDDDAVRYLHGGHVERRRQVDDDAVDLAVLERLHRGVVRVVDERARRGLDAVDDVRVARRAELRAEFVAPETRDRPDLRDGLALSADDRLVDEVVRLREVDGLRAGRAERNLVDVEVERLVAGAVR